MVRIANGFNVEGLNKTDIVSLADDFLLRRGEKSLSHKLKSSFPKSKKGSETIRFYGVHGHRLEWIIIFTVNLLSLC